MIVIFKKNDLLNLLFLLPYTIVLRLYSLMQPTAYTVKEADSFIVKTLFAGLLSTPIVQAVVAIVLVYIQAVMVNQLTLNHRVYRRPSSLAGMTYVLLISSTKDFHLLTPALIAMTFVIITIYSVFGTYKKIHAVSAITNAALGAAMATLIYPPFVILIVALIIGLSIFRNFGLREKLQIIVTYLVCFWIIGVFLYFFNRLDWGFLTNIGFVGTAKEMFFGDNTKTITLVLVGVLLVFTLINNYNFKKKKEIEVRKKIDFLYWMMLSGLVPLLFFKDIDAQHFVFLMMPLSVFVGMSWMMIKSGILAEMLHLSCIALIYYQLFLFV